jgi:hypothetical protein
MTNVTRKIMAPNRLGSTAPSFLVAAAIVAGIAALAPAAKAAQPAPPHAWLYGVWSGGILPAPPDMTAQECQQHPTFVVTQDAVLHGTLTHPDLIQNLIAAVRGTPEGTVFTLAPTETKPETVAGSTEDLGFGCAQPDTLRVVKVGPNQIAFPGCTAFPSPLVRCPMK